MEPFELSYFEDLDYHIVDSGLKTTYRFNERPVLSSLHEFFSDTFDGTVRLIYAEESRVKDLKQLALDTGYQQEEIYVDLEDISQLRTLKAPSFLLVTKAGNMRGLDYRSSDTITLFLAKLCDS